MSAYLRKQGSSDFEFISVSLLFFVLFFAVTVGYIRYQNTLSLKLYDLKIETFCLPFIAVLHKKNM